MRNTIETILLLCLLGALIYLERGQLAYTYRIAGNYINPCGSPILYTVDGYDSRFGISETEFKGAIVEAEGIWEKAAGKELFAYSPTGSLKINLVYDSRQEATEKLKELGLVVKDDRASYDTLKQKYDALEDVYKTRKAAYDAKVTAYNAKRDAYEAQVASWNAKGGAPRDVYAALEKTKAELASTLQSIRTLETDLNQRIDTINALVEELNRLATALNITASEFNQIGAKRGEEFTEGVYENSADGEKIDIYQFDSHQKLVRVLAHELGHALSLDHVDDPKAIMYRLNQGMALSLTAADKTALAAHCERKLPLGL